MTVKRLIEILAAYGQEAQNDQVMIVGFDDQKEPDWFKAEHVVRDHAKKEIFIEV